MLRLAVGSQKERPAVLPAPVAMLVGTQCKLVWHLAVLRGNSKLMDSLGLSPLYYLDIY